MAKYFGLEPVDKNYLEPQAIIKIIIQNFEHYFFDEETARKEAAERLKFLKEMNADQILIDLYKNSNPVRCTLYNQDKSRQYYFDISENTGLMVFPDVDQLQADGLEESVKHLTNKIGYKLTVEEDG